MFERTFQGGSSSGGPIRRKGVGRVLEIILDNLSRFLLSSLLCFLSLVPGALAVLWTLSGSSFLALLAAGFAGGLLFGPAYGAMSDGMLYAVRGIPGNWWRKYRRAWRRDWKGNLIPGGIMGLLGALLAYEGIVLWTEPSFLPTSLYVCTGVCAAVAIAVYTYFWPQRVFSDLKNRQIFKNSRLMILMHPMTALKALLVQLLYWAVLVIGFPYSVIALPLLGFWFPELLGLLVVYPQLNEDFKIEERLGGEDMA